MKQIRVFTIILSIFLVNFAFAAKYFTDFVAQDGKIQMKERAVGPAASSGYGILYPKTDNRLYYLDDTGSEFDVLLGGSAQLDNLLDVDTTGVATGDALVYDGTNWIDSDILNATDGAVKIGTGNASASSIFSVFSSNKGTQPCVLHTTTSRNAIASPDLGLCIYNVNDLEFQQWNGSNWVGMGGGGISPWVTATDYVIDDVVIYNYKIYSALANHTSGTFSTDFNTNGYWVEISDDVNGPASTTVRTIPIWLDATGDLLGTSNIQISATDSITGVSRITATESIITPALNINTFNNGSVLFQGSNGVAQDNDGFYYDSTNKRLGIGLGASENTISIGGTTYGSVVSVHAQGATDLAETAVHRHTDTAAYSPAIIAARSRGTESAETVVQSGDTLSRYIVTGNDGTDYESAADIIGVVDGTPGNNDMPGRLVFRTTPDGSATPTERLRISNDGTVAVSNGKLTVDNLQLDANTLSSTDTNGNIVLDPNGTGGVNYTDLTASRPLKLDSSKNATADLINLASANDVTGTLPVGNGGTGQTTIASGDILYGVTGNAINKLSIGGKGTSLKVATGNVVWLEPEYDLDNTYQEDFEGSVLAANLSTGDNSTILGAGAISGTVANETTNFIHGMGSEASGTSIKYTQAAGSLNDYICGPEINIGSSTNKREKQNFLGITLEYLYDGASGDIKVGLYDVTNSTFLATSLDVLNAASRPTRYATANYIPSTTQKLRWCIQTVVANSGKILYFDDIQISTDPYKFVKLTNSTPWATYTPATQGVGSPTITRAQWRIVGDSIEIQARLTTGTVTGTEFQFGLPGTYAVNTGLDAEVVGYAHRNATTEAQYPVLATADDTFLNVGFRDATTANVITPKNGSYLFGSAETVTINATVPIKNLSYSVENLVTPANSPRQTTLTTTGTGWTDVRSVGTYYKTSDGAHRLKFNIYGTVSSAARTNYSIAVSGVTFKNVSGYDQAISAYGANSPNLQQAYVSANSSTIAITHSSATTTYYIFSGDVELNAKPTWADDVHTNFLAAVPANIVTSPESTHTQPKVCSFALSTTSDLLSEITGSCFSGTSCTSNGTGDTTCTFKTGYWTTQEQCSCSAATTNFGRSCSAFDSTTSVQIIRSNGASAEDGAVNVVCHGY